MTGSSLAVCAAVAVLSAPSTDARVLRVGVEITPPFVLHAAGGEWTGASVTLWERVADDLELSFEYVEDGEADLVDLLRADRIDVAVSALAISPQDEARVDFTHPYLMTGLAIAVPRRLGPGAEILRSLLLFMSPPVLSATVAMLAVVVMVGVGIWLLERQLAPGDRSIKSLEDGFWWSVVTMTTVGYGDKTPDTRLGRVVAAGWMLVSLAMLSVFTAVLASSFTAAEFKRVQGPEDLRHISVGTVRSSGAASYLRRQGIQHSTFPFLLHALRALRRGDVEAVVYDAPTLRYVIEDYGWSDLTIEGQGFEPVLFAFALREGSPWREPINRALLRHAPSWRREVGLHLAASR